MSFDDVIPYNDHELPMLSEEELVDAYRELRTQLEMLRGALQELNAEHLKRIVTLTRERDATRAAYTKVWNELEELRERQTSAAMQWVDRPQTMPQGGSASTMGITRPPTALRRVEPPQRTPPTGMRRAEPKPHTPPKGVPAPLGVLKKPRR